MGIDWKLIFIISKCFRNPISRALCKLQAWLQGNLLGRNPLFTYCPSLLGGCKGTYFMFLFLLYAASGLSFIYFKIYILITVSSCQFLSMSSLRIHPFLSLSRKEQASKRQQPNMTKENRVRENFTVTWRLDQATQQKENGPQEKAQASESHMVTQPGVPWTLEYKRRGPGADPCQPSAYCFGLYELTWPFLSWFREPRSPGILLPLASYTLSVSSSVGSPALRREIGWRHPIQSWVFQGLTLCVMSGCGWVSVAVHICIRSKCRWCCLNKVLIYENSRIALGIFLLLIFEPVVFGFTLNFWAI